MFVTVCHLTGINWQTSSPKLQTFDKDVTSLTCQNLHCTHLVKALSKNYHKLIMLLPVKWNLLTNYPCQKFIKIGIVTSFNYLPRWKKHWHILDKVLTRHQYFVCRVIVDKCGKLSHSMLCCSQSIVIDATWVSQVEILLQQVTVVNWCTFCAEFIRPCS